MGKSIFANMEDSFCSLEREAVFFLFSGEAKERRGAFFSLRSLLRWGERKKSAYREKFFCKNLLALGAWWCLFKF